MSNPLFMAGAIFGGVIGAALWFWGFSEGKKHEKLIQLYAEVARQMRQERLKK